MVTRKEILHRYPFFRLVVPVVVGIFTGISGLSGVPIPLPIVVSLFLVTCFLPFLSKAVFSFRTRWISGVVIFVSLLLFSYDCAILSFRRTGGGTIARLPRKERIYQADVVEPPVRKEKSIKAIVKITACREKDRWLPACEKVLVYIGKDEDAMKLFYGDRLLFRALLTEPEPPVVPGGFDNRKFLHFRGIYYKSYIKQGRWISAGVNGQNWVFHFALELRRKLLDIFRQKGLEGREFGVASALLLGYVDEVDSDLMKDYAATGVLHILSVSGMHVGMIFLVITKLLGFFERWKGGKIIKALLSVLLIWFYALLTGLSPAVLRAAAMLSLVIVGNTLKRNPDTLNILGASFFFLLVWDPRLLADMGFQLSYLAVAGIVVLYKPIFESVVVTNRILGKVWALVAVSLAAQLATTPLSLYYFNQFPNYFLLANLFVVPFSNLIIYAGILTLVLSGIPFLSAMLATVLSWSIGFLNGSIHLIGSLPGSVTRGIFFQVHETVIIYCMVVLVALFIRYKYKRWFFLALFLIVILQGSFLINKLDHYNTRHFYVYGVRNSGLYDCISKGSSLLIGDTRSLENAFFNDNLKRSWFHLGVLGKYRLSLLPGIKNNRPFRDPGILFRRGDFFQFCEKRMAVVNKKVPKGLSREINLDYLIISGNPDVRLSQIVRNYKAKGIIIDNSNSSRRTREWLNEAEKMNLSCYSVSEDGSFMTEF